MPHTTDAYLDKAFPVVVPFDKVRVPVLNAQANDLFNDMDVVVRATKDYKTLMVCFSSKIVYGKTGPKWLEPKHSKAVSQLVGMYSALDGCNTGIELHMGDQCVSIASDDCALNSSGYEIIPIEGLDYELARVHRKFTTLCQGRAEALTNFASAYSAQD